jgi:hypothetical protein
MFPKQPRPPAASDVSKPRYFSKSALVELLHLKYKGGPVYAKLMSERYPLIGNHLWNEMRRSHQSQRLRATDPKPRYALLNQM